MIWLIQTAMELDVQEKFLQQLTIVYVQLELRLMQKSEECECLMAMWQMQWKRSL